MTSPEELQTELTNMQARLEQTEIAARELEGDMRARLGQTEIAAGELEGGKMMVDVAKHLTTLSSGSILLLTTFLSDIFTGKDVSCTGLRGPILLTFLVALLFAVAVAWLVPLRILYRPRERVTGDWRLRFAQRLELGASMARGMFYRLSAVAFFMGVLLLLIFGAVNFGMLKVEPASAILSFLRCDQ